jgi:hypothetical protein
MTLSGKIAFVAGATRGAGRGIAVQLGAAGATVNVTERTIGSQLSDFGRATETIEETAQLVFAAGSVGVAFRVDHLVPEEVSALVDRVEAEQGALHFRVNDIWGGETLFEWNTATIPIRKTSAATNAGESRPMPERLLRAAGNVRLRQPRLSACFLPASRSALSALQRQCWSMLRPMRFRPCCFFVCLTPSSRPLSVDVPSLPTSGRELRGSIAIDSWHLCHPVSARLV